LGNENLTASCEYVKEMIDYTRSQYRKFGDSLAQSDVDKIYLTMSDSNEYGNKLELEMYKAFFKQNIECYDNRQKAIEAMVNESQENDILYIAGRGDRKVYKTDNGSFLEFTDSEYVEKLFNEVDNNASNR
jgi:UDP-N-acetylmuramyl tripeptide synthase